MALRNASRPRARGGPVTPTQLDRLRAALANGQAAGLVEVPWSVMVNVVHDLDVLARLREATARDVLGVADPDLVRDAVRFDRQVRDDALGG